MLRAPFALICMGAAREIRTYALFQLGAQYGNGPKNTGAKGIGTSAVERLDRTKVPTLKELGISKGTSAAPYQKAIKLSGWNEKQARFRRRLWKRIFQIHEPQAMRTSDFARIGGDSVTEFVIDIPAAQ